MIRSPHRSSYEHRHRDRHRSPNSRNSNQPDYDDKRNRNLTKDDYRDRNRSDRREHHNPDYELPLEPVTGNIYKGRVTNILAFGAVVQLDGLKKRWDGLVHVSQLRREGRVTNVADVVSRHQKVCFVIFFITYMYIFGIFFFTYFLLCK